MIAVLSELPSAAASYQKGGFYCEAATEKCNTCDQRLKQDLTDS